MKQIIECVPNFSEGRESVKIEQIRESIAAIKGVRVLNVDPGKATNRTVITFAGEVDGVMEAAFMAVKCASEVIDMRQHHGEHPRLGATDVLPIVPISGISLEECATLARKLAQRIYEELRIPTYCYEAAAFMPRRRNLAVCRHGEYEMLPLRVTSDDAPDFGSGTYDLQTAMSGATNVGARDFLIAVNFNLNTSSTDIANRIAGKVREKGAAQRDENGKVIKDENGNTLYTPGALKCCKAIGWYIEEYGCAQVSMNLTDINTTPLHIVYEEVCKFAKLEGFEVTGTEIIGLVPKRVLVEAGDYFTKEKEHKPLTELETIEYASKHLGLSTLRAYKPKERIIEYLLEAESEPLCD